MTTVAGQGRGGEKGGRQGRGASGFDAAGAWRGRGTYKKGGGWRARGGQLQQRHRRPLVLPPPSEERAHAGLATQRTARRKAPASTGLGHRVRGSEGERGAPRTLPHPPPCPTHRRVWVRTSSTTSRWWGCGACSPPTRCALCPRGCVRAATSRGHLGTCELYAALPRRRGLLPHTPHSGASDSERGGARVRSARRRRRGGEVEPHPRRCVCGADAVAVREAPSRRTHHPPLQRSRHTHVAHRPTHTHTSKVFPHGRAKRAPRCFPPATPSPHPHPPTPAIAIPPTPSLSIAAILAAPVGLTIP